MIASVHNTGGTSLNNVSVRFYNGGDVIDEQIVSVPSGDSVIVTYGGFTMPEGAYGIGVRVDEDNIKIESDELNNNDYEILTVHGATCGDVDHSGGIDIVDVVGMVNVAFRGQSVGDPAWIWDLDGNGAVDVLDVVGIINAAFRGQSAPTCSSSSAQL